MALSFNKPPSWVVFWTYSNGNQWKNYSFYIECAKIKEQPFNSNVSKQQFFVKSSRLTEQLKNMHIACRGYLHCT